MSSLEQAENAPTRKNSVAKYLHMMSRFENKTSLKLGAQKKQKGRMTEVEQTSITHVGTYFDMPFRIGSWNLVLRCANPVSVCKNG